MKWLILCACLGMIATSGNASESNSIADRPWKKTETVQNGQWHGFAVHLCPVNEFSMVIAEPRQALPGRPWVMYIGDFGDSYHWQINEGLLKVGVYVAAINSYNMYGADRGLDLMDKLYSWAREKYQLAPKCGLFGVSRAGLSIYRWAIRHPDRTACLYAEGPVLDFKSWPMRWAGSATNWVELKRYYGFKTDEEACSYRGTPIDQLAIIAQEKIPIRHVISLTDEHDTKVVPNEDNTLKARKILSQMGHEMEVIVIPEGMKAPYACDGESIQFMVKHVGKAAKQSKAK